MDDRRPIEPARSFIQRMRRKTLAKVPVLRAILIYAWNALQSYKSRLAARKTRLAERKASLAAARQALKVQRRPLIPTQPREIKLTPRRILCFLGLHSRVGMLHHEDHLMCRYCYRYCGKRHDLPLFCK